MKEYTITMTSKGQFTLPIEVRREFGINKAGDKLQLNMTPKKDEAVLKRPISLEQIRAKAKLYAKPGIPPLLDPRAFYDTRKPRL